MATPVYELPKRNIDSAIVLNTETATDAALATGVLTVLAENGAEALVVKISDIVGYKKTAYSAGTANVKTINFASVSLVGNTIYRLTIKFPNVVNFFGGGQEQSALYTTRTYVVSVDATPTVTELRDAFKARIDIDLQSGVTTGSVSTDQLSLTSIDAKAGSMELEVPTGATITDTTPWVSPSGTTDEVLQYANKSSVAVGGEYTRYEIRSNKLVGHNAIPGLKAVKPIITFVYAEENATDFALFETEMDEILGGTHTPVADYLGAPAL